MILNIICFECNCSLNTCNHNKFLNNDIKCKSSIFSKYIDQDQNIIILLAADSIWTYFQDLFPTTHYLECVGDNDVGKSSVGYTFEYSDRHNCSKTVLNNRKKLLVYNQGLGIKNTTITF